MNLKNLASPFPIEDIEFRAGATNKENTTAMALAYITSRAVMDRLDEVCGQHGWRDEYAAGPNGGTICGIAIKVGDEWIAKWDGADNTNFEGVKGGLSDAFKRAAVKWGIGRYLYKIEPQWVACEKRGNSVVLKANPKLPAWALPAGSKQPVQSVVEQPAHDPEARPSSKADILARVRHYVDAGGKASDSQRGLMVGMIEECFGGSGNEEAKRKSVTMYLFARESSKDLTDAQVLALLDWLDVQKDSGGAYYPCAEASQEAVKIVIAQMKKMGQEAMEL